MNSAQALRCPVCDAALVPVGAADGAPLRQCQRCRGLWAHAEAALAARNVYGDEHAVLVVRGVSTTCRACKKALAPGALRCTRCPRPQRLACVTCAARMEIVAVERVTIDVCRACRSAWFDAGELGAVLALQGARQALTGPPPATPAVRRSTSLWPDVVSAPADMINLADVAVHAADGAGTAAVAVVEGAGHVAVTVVEGSGQLAGEVGSVVVEAIGALLGGIFEGL